MWGSPRERPCLPGIGHLQGGGPAFFGSVAGDGRETGQTPRCEDAGKACPWRAWKAC